MRHFPTILAVAAALALGALAATALWGGEEALQSAPASPLETTERITGAPQPGPTPGGKGLQPPKVRLLQNIRNFSARDLLLDDPGVSQSVKRVLDRCGPCGIDNPIYADVTRDFVDDVILPVVRQNGRITDVFVYSRVGRKIKRIGEYHGPELSVDVSGRFFTRNRDVLIYDIAYAPDDRRCCPSQITFSRFRWDGRKFVRVRMEEL